MIENNNLPENPVNTIDIPKKIDIIGEKTAENYAIISELLKTNINQKTIAKLTNYSEEHICRLKSKLSKIQLVTPKRIKKAIKAVEHFANVENYQDDDRIKPSDVIAAAKIFIDRQYPVTQVIVNHEVKHNLIDLSVYRNDTPSDNVIDVKTITPNSVSQEDNSSGIDLQVLSDNVSG